MVAFNHITGDAGVMLLLLGVIYLACQMVTWYHYYCQEDNLFLFLYMCSHSCFLLLVCVCVCMRAPARYSRNDGTQGHSAVPRKKGCLKQLDRSSMLHEFSKGILYSGELLKCIKSSLFSILKFVLIL